MDIMTPDQRRRTMQAIRSNNTKPEIALRKELWKHGYRNYRKNYKKVIGTPDIAFTKHKVAIFVDSELFHGYNWKDKKERLDTNREFWIAKIQRNMERDKRYTEQLKAEGWIVLRFWEHQVMKNMQECITRIDTAIKQSPG